MAHNNWRTPPELFDQLHRSFAYTIDGAADPTNHLCDTWFGPGAPELADSVTCYGAVAAIAQRPPADAFEAEARHVEKQRIFLNPPYSTDDRKPWVGEWIALARRWAQMDATVVTVLVPPDTGTRWWHDIVMPTASEVWFMTRRIAYIDPDTGEPAKDNTHPSSLIVFRPTERALWRTPEYLSYNPDTGVLRR